MNLSVAYIATILIWSTTPLAIQWSSRGPGFLFGVTSRMLLGLLCVLIINVFLKRSLPVNKAALQSYIASGVGIYGAMLSVYWGAQYIPSGWVSIIFGLAPMITTILAMFLLKEQSLSLNKIVAQVTGLAVIFMSSFDAGYSASLGIIAVLFSAIIHSGSAVIVKRIDANIRPLDSVTGGLLFAVPAYFVTWSIFDGELPQMLSLKNTIAILYLAIIATAGGFVLYYFILKYLSAVKVAMVAMLSPVLALLLGSLLNHEEITGRTIIGAILIITAMFVHDALPTKNEDKSI